MDLKDKRVTVVGLARSGAGAANLLVGLGAVVTVTDRKTRQELEDFVNKLHPSVKLELGGHPAALFENSDLVVLSPGVPMSIPPIKLALDKGVKVIGELELAYQIIRGHGTESRSQNPPFLAVAGTNGKSTTTTLLHEMIKNSGFKSVIGGNIGNALTEEILNAPGNAPSSADCFVVEVSSFQLEAIDEFRPKVASILNITPDHLDRYPSMEEYIDAKCRIFENQRDGDALVLNADDSATGEIIKRGRKLWGTGNAPEISYFSRRNRVKGAYLKDGLVHFEVAGVPAFSLDPASFRIKGVHNIENAMAASLMALLAGCGPAAVEETLRTFPGLEHRLEFVRELDGVRYINDSKGTNVGAVIKSLESFDTPVILIAGGRDKDGDFPALRPLVKERVRALVLIGEARDKILKATDGLVETFMEDDLRSAVARARKTAVAGDVVLLSPACASFDMFRDFEDRGRQFKKIVMELE